MSLKSKWSQRVYELCAQWRSASGFKMAIKELRKMFKLNSEYARYASFKTYVLDVAHKEIKALYDKGQCDLYFEYSENKNGRSVHSLNFKIISSKTENTMSLQDVDYAIRTELSILFETRSRPKNEAFVGEVMNLLRLNPENLEPCYKKILYVKEHIPLAEQARYLRFVLNEEYLKNDVFN
jgi:plasmid replication initiation protein